MVGGKEYSKEDEDCSGATSFDFQEVRFSTHTLCILQKPHIVPYSVHTQKYTIIIICTLCEMYLSVDQPHS